jgi:hypothetical protein
MLIIKMTTVGLGGAQWSIETILAKQFHIFQMNGYFFLKYCLQALFDMRNVLIIVLAKITNIAHRVI